MRLNQIIALEKGVKSRVHGRLVELQNRIRSNALNGLSRTYTPRDEEGEHLPPESTLVQVVATDTLKQAASALSELLDITATKDAANQEATADIVVNGSVLLADIPVTSLIFLEKQLSEFAGFVRRLPTLDPSESWSRDNTLGADIYRTPVVETVKTRKVPRNHVKAPATPQHPAQVDVYFEDVPVGTWSTVKFSGAMPKSDQDAILERVTILSDAVKAAREEANSRVVDPLQISMAVFGYLLG